MRSKLLFVCFFTFVPFVSISCAEERTLVPTQVVDIDAKVGLKMPAEFNMRDRPDSKRSFVAVGTDAEGVVEGVPLIAVYLSPVVPEAQKPDFLARALKGVTTNARNGKRTLNGEPSNYRKNGVDGFNVVSVNKKGTAWWGVRVIHLATHSAILYVAAYDKPSFDQLAEYGQNVALVSK